MTPYYEDDLVQLFHGDCREVTTWLAADVLVTDPPYGRAWRQGDTGKGRGWASDTHDGIANDETTAARDAVLSLWGAGPAVVFGDLMLTAPPNVKHVLIYDKGNDAGFTGAVGGYRRNAEAIYLIGSGHGSGLGGRSAIVSTRTSAGGNLARTTGHPHTKPNDVMEALILNGPVGTIADPFAGSGSTLTAAKHLGRKAIGVELEERYCEIAARRLAQDTLFGGAA
ncbi:MAG: DNA methyltransferase [Pseudonocardiaceae bacterium]